MNWLTARPRYALCPFCDSSRNSRSRLTPFGLAVGLDRCRYVSGSESPFRFTDVTSATGVDFVHTIGDDKLDNIVESSGVGCTLLDYDGDGWLDVYFVNGIYREGLSDPRTPDKDPLAVASDRLYRNLRDGKFQDVTVSSGDRHRGIRHGRWPWIMTTTAAAISM